MKRQLSTLIPSTSEVHTVSILLTSWHEGPEFSFSLFFCSLLLLISLQMDNIVWD